MAQPRLITWSIQTSLAPVLALTIAAAAHAQDCFGIQQEFGSVLSSTVDEANRMAVLAEVPGALSVTIFTANPTTQLFVPDTFSGLVQTNSAAGGDWHLDFVEEYIIAGASLVGSSPGEAYVLLRNAGGYAASPNLVSAIPPGVEVTSFFGADVGLARVGDQMLAFIGDTEVMNISVGPVDGAVTVFDVTDVSNPCYITQILRPNAQFLANALFGDSLDLVQTASDDSGSDQTLRMIVGAPGECPFAIAGGICQSNESGAAYILEIVDYNPDSKTLTVNPVQRITPPGMLGDSLQFGSSVAISQNRAIIGSGSTLDNYSVTYDQVGAVYVQQGTFLSTGNSSLPRVAISRTGQHIIARDILPGSDAVLRRQGGTWVAVNGTLGMGDSFKGTAISDSILSLNLPNSSTNRAGARLACGGPLEAYTFAEVECGPGIAVPNSSGTTSSIGIFGNFDALATSPDLAVTTSGLPPFVFTYHMLSLSSQAPIVSFPTLVGPTCLGAPPIVTPNGIGLSSAAGSFTSSFDVLETVSQMSSGQLMLNGTRVYFQTLHRDVDVQGNPVFNFSSLLSVVLTQ